MEPIMAETQDIDDETLEDLYAWVDKIPMTRPKKDIKRDFADGVLVAEIVHAFIPHLVEVHNYVAAHKYDNKVTNWKLLNRKVFKKLEFQIADDVISNICGLKPMAVELFLLLLRRKIDRYVFEQDRGRGDGNMNDKPESDQIESQAYIPDAPSKSSKLKKTNSSRSLPVLNSNPANRITQPRNSTVVQNGKVTGLPTGKQEMVPKILVEEKAQEILAKDETIQILTAKIRRLEHLLHLKDVRIDDLQGRLDNLEVHARPTAQRANRR